MKEKIPMEERVIIKLEYGKKMLFGISNLLYNYTDTLRDIAMSVAETENRYEEERGLLGDIRRSHAYYNIEKRLDQIYSEMSELNKKLGIIEELNLIDTIRKETVNKKCSSTNLIKEIIKQKFN